MMLTLKQFKSSACFKLNCTSPFQKNKTKMLLFIKVFPDGTCAHNVAETFE